MLQFNRIKIPPHYFFILTHIHILLGHRPCRPFTAATTSLQASYPPSTDTSHPRPGCTGCPVSRLSITSYSVGTGECLPGGFWTTTSFIISLPSLPITYPAHCNRPTDPFIVQKQGLLLIRKALCLGVFACCNVRIKDKFTYCTQDNIFEYVQPSLQGSCKPPGLVFKDHCMSYYFCMNLLLTSVRHLPKYENILQCPNGFNATHYSGEYFGFYFVLSC